MLILDRICGPRVDHTKPPAAYPDHQTSGEQHQTRDNCITYKDENKKEFMACFFRYLFIGRILFVYLFKLQANSKKEI